MSTPHYVPKSARGVICQVVEGCDKPAAHKIGEYVFEDDPRYATWFHELTAYLCCDHFSRIVARCGGAST